MSSHRFGLRARMLPFLVPFLIAGVVVYLRWPDAPSKPVDVAASGPPLTTVDELVAGSDLIVIATVERVGSGRVFTDPADPAAGIRTQLADLAVERVLKGEPARAVVLEEEAALLDGRPITVNGTAPSRAGERGIYFLIASDDEEAPYHALIGPQGRYLIDGNALRTTARDPLSTDLASRGLDALLRAI
jgi:hypothetical protein